MEKPQLESATSDRRSFLTNFGKAAVVAPPVITALLSTSMSSPAIAKSTGTRTKGNNGLGNGDDPQPPGNPKPNDTNGATPGNPGSQGSSGNSGNSGNNGNGPKPKDKGGK